MTKERLRAYQKNKQEREQLRQQLEEIEAALYYPKIQRLTAMPSAPVDGNPQEDLAIRHIELQERYRAKLDELAGEQLAIEQAIESLEQTQRLLMRYRYLEGLKWETICCKINYGWTQTHHIHGEALKALRRYEESLRE